MFAENKSKILTWLWDVAVSMAKRRLYGLNAFGVGKQGQANVTGDDATVREAVAIPVDDYRRIVGILQAIYDDVTAYGPSEADLGYLETTTLAKTFLPKPQPSENQ